ncbi:disease resistance protein RPM1-like [Quercus robur]|uniref:disease resistance protein RPM1-like n=1 Tax=Quercus robur TaxID=38942 RepID=UPI00216398E0|nr:disease resistance protein RPM1-like [Quercus robur]
MMLKNIKKSGERYGSNVIEQRRSNSDAISDTWHDPRMASLLIEEAEVVGIESRREKLINWLVEGPSNRMVISTVGIGGLGKTTLVKKMYENDKVTAHFDCHAWITVSKSYKMEELLRNMIKQLYKAKKQSIPVEIDTMEQTTLMEQIRLYLHEHRYVVVFDDVWKKEFWDYIELALPKNEKGNRILITS